ncbi:MAG: transglycosylase domain-containing protein [Oscillospiraceae bacterium]|nr:transglycosylase domain-containing protein [Oscillospiraceae bacterium]
MVKFEIKSEKFKRFKNKLLNAITVMFCMGIIVCCIIGVVLTIYVASIVRNKRDIDMSGLSCSTIIYANDKQENPYTVAELHGSENRIWVDFEELPEYIGNAAIAVEDKRFLHHRGIDFLRTAKASFNEIFPILPGRQGGSTITQQLVRNITGDRAQTAARKIREIIRALYLEKRLTKQEILEKYLNVVYFGNNTNGIEAAALLYFDKPAKYLTLQEAVAIIGITQSPVSYDPFLHPERNKKRREYVLRCMLGAGFIKQEQYDEAVSSELKLADRNNPKNKTDGVNSYFVDRIIENVAEDLMKKNGWTEQYAVKMIYSGGYRIYTTMDGSIQNILQDEFAESSVFSHVTGGQDLQAAMVIMDPNGAVKGIVGGIGKKKINRGLNRATGAIRQPGSAIKPISVYALAVENNLLHYSSLVSDRPIIEKTDKAPAWPQNVNQVYNGNILLPYAIAHSSNAVAVQVCKQLGAQECFNFMKQKLGISTLVESSGRNGRIFTDADLAPMGLGALTSGVSVLELTGAYQIFSNGGNFTKPYFYTKVLNSKGEVILENKIQPKRAISRSTALIMRKLLQNVIRSGTGTAAQFRGFDIFGKTGTTTESKDVWFVGATPYYIGGVWVGYDRRPKPMNFAWRDYPPTNLWRKVMEKVHQDLKPKKFEFEGDKSVIHYMYCADTGLLASDKCPRRQDGIYSSGLSGSKNIPGMCSGGHTTPAEEAAQEAAQIGQPLPNEQATIPATSPAVSTATPTGEQVAENPLGDQKRKGRRVKRAGVTNRGRV